MKKLSKETNVSMTTYDLLSWGANSHHQLGQGTESEQCLIPTAVNLKISNSTPEVNEIKKVTGGAGHSLILTTQGEVYSCGLNSKGQAGQPSSIKTLKHFKKLEHLSEEIIVDVVCGWDSSMAVNKEGHIFVWGSNAYGQLGVGTSGVKFLSKPTKIGIFDIDSDPETRGEEDPVVDVAMGLRHSVVLTESGRVFVSGNGNKCQLGITDSSNETIRNTDTFTRVPELIGIKKVACGQHHTMVLNKYGDIYAWGDNKHGQLGFDVKKYPSIKTPLKLKNINVGNSNAEIFTGWTHTAVLYDGKVVAWGRNSYGQTGRGESINKYEETWEPKFIAENNLTKFIQLAVGSEHNIALREDGSIMCWGWNEHGNCGTGTDKDVRVPMFVETQKNSRGILVGTGSGHSFAIVERNSTIL